MSEISDQLEAVLGTTGGGYLRDEDVTVVMAAAAELRRLQRIVDGVHSKTALDIVAEKMTAEDELARIVKVITNCRETAELQASPDGPSGDVTNLLAKLSNCERQIGYVQESAAEWSAAARGHCDTIEERDKTIASLEEALEWYADPESYNVSGPLEGGAWGSAPRYILTDGGQKARDVLKRDD
jgi:hypothetical protein